MGSLASNSFCIVRVAQAAAADLALAVQAVSRGLLSYSGEPQHTHGTIEVLDTTAQHTRIIRSKEYPERTQARCYSIETPTLQNEMATAPVSLIGHCCVSTVP